MYKKIILLFIVVVLYSSTQAAVGQDPINPMGSLVVLPNVQTPHSGLFNVATPFVSSPVPGPLIGSSSAPTNESVSVEVVKNSTLKHGIMHITMDQRLEIAQTFLTMIKVEDSPVTTAGSSNDILRLVPYIPSQRDQGMCGNCWVWASTGAIEVAHAAQNAIKDRLSIQYFDSNYNGGTGTSWACDGGWANTFATFYKSAGKVIPWSNTNAGYADGNACTSSGWSGGAKTPASSIATTPNYAITSIDTATLNTYGVSQQTAISNIKAQINANKAVWWGFYLPTSSAFDTFWSTQSESALWNPDTYNNITCSSSGGGHAVLIVGYDDTSADPNQWSWKVLNSWGTISQRPNGVFRVKINMNYSGNTGSQGYPNHYYYVFNMAYSGGSTQTGNISFTTSPAGARVWKDGTDTGKNTPVVLSGITPGAHSISLKLTGYQDYSATVTVTAGRTENVNANLTPVVSTGNLTVASSPAGASIWLDGVNTNLTTPATLTRVTAGTHQVILKLAGYYDATKSVKLNAGGTIPISAQLTAAVTNGTISVVSSPTLARIYLDGADTGKNAPATLTDVKPGTHTVALLITTNVTVTAGKATRLSGSLYQI